MHDVIVIGGGPGGLYAARELARRAFDVVVIEEHHTIGAPVHCTGILAANAFDEFDLLKTSILNPLQKVTFLGPSGQRVDYSTDTSEASVIDRIVFDEVLSTQALANGAQLMKGKRVTDVSFEKDAICVSVGDSVLLRARAGILACGANYSLHRKLKLGVPAMSLQSAQAELPARIRDTVEVYFGNAVAPRGFAWTVPVHRPEGFRVRVGLMCDNNAAGHFDNFVNTIREKWEIPATCVIQSRKKILPLAPIRKTYGPRFVAIGDAAGLVKGTTGGGIYYAVASARLAVESLTEGLLTNSLGEESMSRYEQRWKKLLCPELEAQAEFRSHAERLRDSQIDALFDLAQTNGILPLVRKTATFNRHRKLISALLGHIPFRRLFLSN